ncbi:MAG: ATP-binding cassette domain-containing protein, partial [Candidatus Saganbacteria bacterium]|nr:ATP-binding cassette domain-containing protein [Candidatus Saganbacteria bacterium]
MLIKTENLEKSYGSKKVVNQISVEVKQGEIVGILGPNGAGKTTTMKIITSFWTPTSGRVEVDGLDIREHSIAARRKIGYLPET